MSVESYYDLRGQWRLENQSQDYGAISVSAELRKPYTLAENIIKKIPSNSHVLDLCCGDGVHSIFPAKLGHTVMGIDLSKKSIEAAEWLANSQNVSSKCQFQDGDAMRFLEESRGKFDLIFISGSLYYFDLQEITPKIRAALKPDGQFICIGTNGENTWANLYRWTKQSFTNYRDSATMTKLLKKNDWQYLKETFPNSSLRFYSFTTLFAKAVPRKFGLRLFFSKILEPMDGLFLRLPLLWRFGFKFMFIGKKDV